MMSMSIHVIRAIFISIIGMNLGILLICNCTSANEQLSPRMMSSGIELEAQEEGDDIYKFHNSTMAYKILQKLDVFEPYYGTLSQKAAERNYRSPFLGLNPDVEYCDKQRSFFANDPNYIFTEKNIVSGYWPGGQVRKIALKQAGNDIMRDVGGHRGKVINKGYSIDLRPDVMAIMTALDMYSFRHVGQQFSCLAQMTNHIPGHDSLYRKDHSAQSANEYALTYANRPQCFNFDKFFPKNYLLTKEDQCKEFFRVIDTPEYQSLKKERNIVYMRKIGFGAHAGTGVFPVDGQEETYIRSLYKNGTQCGKIKNNNIMQSFVHNPLLIKGRKFDFRMFMLIASTNPFIVYYHDGCLRVSLNQYDLNGGSKKTLLTNTAMSKEVFNQAEKQGTLDGKTVSDLKEEHSWTFSRFQEYLLETGVIQDPNWLDNYLRPEFKKAMIHLVRMSQHTFLKRSSLFELYGLDFMLDENMNLWFIEANVRPSLEGHTADNLALKMNMVIDHFEIVFGILRSRMKRVFHYVNDMIRDREAWINSDGEIEILDLEEKMMEFKEVSKNFMDPKFEPRPENGFSKIIDENYSGTKRYAGFISEECL